MDAQILKQLRGVVTVLRVGYSRKLGDGNYGSAGWELAVELAVPAGADVDALANEGHEFCKEHVAELAKAFTEALPKPTQAPQTGQEPPPAPEAPQTLPAPQSAPEPVRVPVDEAGKVLPETETIELVDFRVDEINGKRSAKCFGGHYVKFGVICWPEVMATAGVDIVACQTGQKYPFPKGVTKAVVELKEDGKPKKVVSFA